MAYVVTNTRSGFELMQRFEDYDAALDFYRHECAEIGGPVIMARHDDEGRLDRILHTTRG